MDSPVAAIIFPLMPSTRMLCDEKVFSPTRFEQCRDTFEHTQLHTTHIHMHTQQQVIILIMGTNCNDFEIQLILASNRWGCESGVSFHDFHNFARKTQSEAMCSHLHLIGWQKYVQK